MGAIATSVLCGKKLIHVNLIGLNGSGKTRILYTYILGAEPFFETNPTPNCNLELIKYKNYSFQIVDFGNREELRTHLPNMFTNKPILIFVIDSADRENTDSSREYLDSWISYNGVENVILLIFANKQDLPDAMTVPEIIDKFKLETLTCRWHIQPCVGITSAGVNEGFDWICDNLL